ncbi:MAG: NAD-dependent epimerase/dehydratase family protein [Thermoguttaceae bacterium]|jgi:nucleoside-diphosphate-sugar epimerase
MTKILITGANGFIGAHLLQELVARGHDVTCLVRCSSVLERIRRLAVRLVEGDITDRESLPAAVAGQEVVFQLAGCLRALRVEQFFEVNQQGLSNVAWACARLGTPPVLVACSSLAAVGPSAAGRPRIESDRPAPVSYYGRSKWAGERALRPWADRLPITIVRPPVVFGESDRATRELFWPIARLGLHLAPGWREQRFSLIHAADLVALLILAAERGKRIVPAAAGDSPSDAGDHPDPAVRASGRNGHAEGQKQNGNDPEFAAREAGPSPATQGYYFAAAERDVTYAEFGRMIGTALGRRRTQVVHLEPVTVWTAAGVATMLGHFRGRPPYFSVDKAREARAGSWTCSPAAAARELGFAVAAPLAERIRQTALWYREHGWL